MYPLAPGEGYIYFVTDDVAIKIGFSTEPARRLEDLQIAHHVELRMMGTVRAPEHQERLLHNRFHHLWIRGEWFRKDDDLVEFIDDLEEMGHLVSAQEHKMNLKLKKHRKRFKNNLTDR